MAPLINREGTIRVYAVRRKSSIHRFVGMESPPPPPATTPVPHSWHFH